MHHAVAVGLQYVNRGLFNLRANGWLRGWGGCGRTLNGKPALLCAVVMGGDYLTMQKDWMNAPPQIGCSLSLLPSLSFEMFIIYVILISHTNAFIILKRKLRKVRMFYSVRWCFFLDFLLFVVKVRFVIFCCKHCSDNTLNYPATICTCSSSDVTVSDVTYVSFIRCFRLFFSFVSSWAMPLC